MFLEALENKTYEFAGQLLAYSIVHRGPLPNFFTDLLYTSISEGSSHVTPELTDVTDESTHQQLKTVRFCYVAVVR